jgi:hypothetical protein
MAKSIFSLSIEDVIALLNTYTFNANPEPNKITGTTPKGDTVEVVYNMSLTTGVHDIEKMPVQIVFYIRINGSIALTYGCWGNADNAKFVRFWLETKPKAFEAEYKIKKEREESIKADFEAELLKIMNK